MKLCPKCQHLELEGALFCSECGTQLIFVGVPPTQDRPGKDFSSGAKDRSPGRAPGFLPRVGGESVISLSILDDGKLIPLSGRKEYTLGRAVEGQSILPDVDLSIFDAYGHGVSRLHAAIKLIDLMVVIVDLGSANGTRVNGQKILPNVNFPINDGDVIALGRLKIKVTINHRPD